MPFTRCFRPSSATSASTSSPCPPGAISLPPPRPRTPTEEPVCTRSERKEICFYFMMIFMMMMSVMAFLKFSNAAVGVSVLFPDYNFESHNYQPAVAEFNVVDNATKDPWTNKQRTFKATLFMPVPKWSCSKLCQHSYMPDQTAKICNEQFIGKRDAGVFEDFQYNACCAGSEPHRADNISVVVFEPHTDTSRLMYANMARFISAQGVAVMLLDHPHDTAIVELDNGPTVYNSGATKLSNFAPLTAWNQSVTNAINIRINDIHAALSHLGNHGMIQEHFPSMQFYGDFNTSSWSIVGHGLGGLVATYLTLFSDDSKPTFSLNLAGAAPPLDLAQDTHFYNFPIWFMTPSTYTRENALNWNNTYHHLAGFFAELDFTDADIMDFSDLPHVIDLATEHEGRKGLKGKGLGKHGIWAYYSIVCFAEGIVKKEHRPSFDEGADSWQQPCWKMFDEHVRAHFGPSHPENVGVGPGRVRRRSLGRRMRQNMETWGFL